MYRPARREIGAILKVLKKHIKLWIILLVLVAICVPMILTSPGEEALSASVSKEFYETESKKSSEVYHDWKLFSTLVMTKQITSNRAVRFYAVGVFGTVHGVYVEANNALTFGEKIVKFVANCTSWIPNLLEGAKITISLTICSVTVGILLSVFLALAKMSKLRLLKGFASGYIFLFRGTPLLMQLFFIYYGLPLMNPNLAINDRFTAAWIAFALNSAAYCAEIIRAGIQSIDKGQFEAAKALGFSYGKTMRKIIIPQTYRRLIPPIANEFIMVLKDASLTSIIALQDLSKITQSIMTSTNDVMIYIPSMVIYLIITGVFTKLFNKLEVKFSVYE